MVQLLFIDHEMKPGFFRIMHVGHVSHNSILIP
jgi:hypothetical protein